jgi:hypothetical protein
MPSQAGQVFQLIRFINGYKLFDQRYFARVIVLLSPFSNVSRR